MLQVVIATPPHKTHLCPPTRLRRPTLQAGQFRFTYHLPTGEILTGTVVGDRFSNQPHIVFNLRHLNARYCDRTGKIRLTFDHIFGQFHLDFPGALFTMTDTATESFCSLSYRGTEVMIYDAIAPKLATVSWEPSAWTILPLQSEKLRLQIPDFPMSRAWSQYPCEGLT